MLMILNTQLQKGLSKAALREPKRQSSIQCHEERERASERGKLPLRASEREREEREGENQERPVAACGARLLSRACVRDWVVNVRGSGARTKPNKGRYAAKWASPSG